MKSKIALSGRILVCCAILFCSFFSQTSAQQTARMTSGGTGYLEYLPAGYAANPTKKYPAIIFLHGAGETGSGSPADLEKVKSNGPPKLIQAGNNMCFTVNGQQECFIVLSPQLSPGAGGWWPSIQQSFLDYVMNGPPSGEPQTVHASPAKDTDTLTLTIGERIQSYYLRCTVENVTMIYNNSKDE
jgi:hypothetical protein